MSKDYQQLLEQLRTKEIDALEITTAEFMDFQRVLSNYNYRKNVVGTAKRGGGATYHYQETSE